MSDDARGDELGDLDDALFGDGAAKPAPAREPAPSADIDWFAGIGDEPAAPMVAADLPAELMPEHEPVIDPVIEPAIEALPGLEPTPSSMADTEGPLVDAAIFGMSSQPAPQPLSRRELHTRPPENRRRRVLILLLVIALIALVGVGVAAVATGGSDKSAAKSQVKVVGTGLPTTTASTRPLTTLAPATVAPTTPPATVAAVVNTPARTNPPVVATDPPAPPPTDPPPTTTTTTKALAVCPPDCVGPPPTM